jgi:hypothetical protein
LDLIARRQQLQDQANVLAIEESNLAEQIEHLRAAERHAVEVNREKHRIIGAIRGLDEVIQAQTAESKDDKK